MYFHHNHTQLLSLTPPRSIPSFLPSPNFMSSLFITTTTSNLCVPNNHGFRDIHQSIVNLSVVIHTFKENWLSLPVTINCEYSSVRVRGPWVPPLSLLECWLVWYCAGLVWANKAAESLWEQEYCHHACPFYEYSEDQTHVLRHVEASTLVTELYSHC